MAKLNIVLKHRINQCKRWIIKELDSQDLSLEELRDLYTPCIYSYEEFCVAFFEVMAEGGYGIRPDKK